MLETRQPPLESDRPPASLSWSFAFLVCVTVVALGLLPSSSEAQGLAYEGDVLPGLATPPWSSNGGLAGIVVADPLADGGSALEMETFGSASWGLPAGSLALDNSTGWYLEIRHLALDNSGGTLANDELNDDSDHLRVSDGELILFVDFRPLEARVSSDSFVAPCSSRPLYCSFLELPSTEYVTVRISVKGDDFVAKVGDQPAFHGRKSAESAGARRIGFGNGSASNPKRSLARWDYLRISSSGPEAPVVIDVKPGSDPNSINPSSAGVVPVAVITTSVAAGEPSDFDATEVDPLSVRLGPGSALAAHGGHVEDVDADGDLDLVVHFRSRDVGVGCGDESLALSGQTFDGLPVAGSDAIRVVGRDRGCP